MTDPDAVGAFLAACQRGDAGDVERLVRADPALLRARGDGGATGLHRAVKHPEVVRRLLALGADPNARDEGDNALPLHWAAGYGHVDAVTALVEGGSDVQGEGDLHTTDTIGWATCLADARRDVVDILVRHGARHHVFSAIAMGDVALLREVIARDPAAIRRRLSQYEQHQAALHYVVAPADGLVGGTFRTGDHYALLSALIEAGAELDATDMKGRTALEVAMRRGDDQAMRLLHGAGATLPPDETTGPADPLGANLVNGMSCMLSVPDMAMTVKWYQAIGFTLVGSHGDGDELDWAAVAIDGHEVMFSRSAVSAAPAVQGVGLWFRTDQLDALYARLRAMAMRQSRARLVGQPLDEPRVALSGDLYTAFYGQREFSLRDPNGVDVNFFQPVEPS